MSVKKPWERTRLACWFRRPRRNELAGVSAGLLKRSSDGEGASAPTCYERFGAIHSPAGWHIAAGRGSLVARRGGLSLPPGCTPAESRFPDDQRERAGTGRRSADRGLIAGRAARATLRANRRRFRNHFRQLVRRIVDYDPIRSQPRHQRRGARRPGRDQRRRRRIAERAAESAVLPQSQSFRRAHHDPGHDFGHVSALRSLQSRRPNHRPAHQPGGRRQPGDHRRRREVRRARAGQSGRARVDGPEPRRHSHDAFAGERQLTERSARWS